MAKVGLLTSAHTRTAGQGLVSTGLTQANRTGNRTQLPNNTDYIYRRIVT